MAASGSLPSDIWCARDYEALAAEALAEPVLAHLMGGAGQGRAARANVDALAEATITPRVLRDLTSGSTAYDFAGRSRAHPIWLAPVGFQALFHPGAEIETSRGADAVEAGMALSTLSSCPLEDIARGARSERWFQLYFQADRAASLDLVQRAEAAGCTALMLTVDAAVKPVGLSSLRAGFRGEERAANLEPYLLPPVSTPPAGQSRVFQGLLQAAPTWADIDWLRERTKLPLWLKGVLHPDDAQTAVSAGAAGIVVSNHGGRTLDAAPPSLSALPAVRAAVGDAFPLMFDGGVHSGEDVFRAIALGADAVMVGRLQACALAVAGALGVAHMVRLLREELEACMAMAGCASIAEIRVAEVTLAGEGTGIMLIVIDGVLSKDEVAAFRGQLETADWVDGTATAGALARSRKTNAQLDDNSPVGIALGEQILRRLGATPLFISAALPNKIYPPKFNRYTGGAAYGAHVDSALMRTPRGEAMIRSDLSATLFLSEPEEYEGGELQIEGPFGVQPVKLAAGDLVLYPSSSLHRVTPVTQGARLASFFWIESHVRDDGERALLFDLDQAIQALTPLAGSGSDGLLKLTGVYHNLLRRWVAT